MTKILRITTINLSLEKLLSGQIDYMERLGYNMSTASFGEFNYKNHINISHLRRAINPIQDVLALLQLIALIRKIKPQIVHTHTPKAGLLGMCAAWICGVKIRLHTVAGLPLMEKSGMLYKLLIVMERLTYSFSTRVHPNSKGLLDFIHKSISRNKKITIIGRGTSNGINLNHFNPTSVSEEEKLQLISQYNLKDKLVYLFVGRMVRDKGVVETVKAFVKLNKEQPETALVLVGPFEPELDPIPDEILEEMESHPCIHTVGYQEDVRPYITVSDILVFPSYREGFPNVPLQCGAFKKALILSDINGCNEIVEHEVTGVLVQPKSESELLAAMKLLAEDETKRAMYGEKVFDFICENFQQEEVWKAIDLEYNKQISLLTTINV
jgi:glycosyltransferase involved in cell wall biosynthesis